MGASNEPTTLVFILGAIVVLVAVGVSVIIFMTTESGHKKTLESIAARFGSKLNPTGWNSHSWFAFRHGNIPIHVQIERPTRKGNLKLCLVQVRFPWFDASDRLNIYPESLPDKLKKFVGLEDIVIGSPQFDRDFIIQGNRETLAELLSPAAQQFMSAIAKLGRRRDGSFAIVGSNFTVRKFIEFGTLQDQTIQHVNNCLGLYDVWVAERSQGMQFIEVTETRVVQTAKSPVCTVCGDRVEHQKVYCRSCQTPHHQECWEYVGRCSIYGCGQVKYSTRSRTSSPEPPVVIRVDGS